MISAKEAVQRAKAYAAEILEQPAANLEEFERCIVDEREVWSITLSFPRYPSSQSTFQALRGADPFQYKRFLIDAETGELIAVKMREFAAQ